jgi:small GTP-binding protein
MQGTMSKKGKNDMKPGDAQGKEAQQEQQPLAVLEKKLKGHRGRVNSVAVSPDGKWVVSGSWDKTIKIWGLKSGQCRATLKREKDFFNHVAITPDGTRILSGSKDNIIYVWDARTYRHLATWKGHTERINAVAVLPKGKKGLSGAGDHTLKLWYINSGECLTTLRGHNDEVMGVAVTPDGKRAVSGSNDETIKYWDLETGGCIATMKGHSGLVNSVQVTPDGRYAVSGSNDKTVKLWDLETGTCKGTFEGHKSNVYSVAISPDCNLVASTGFLDRTVRIWDLKSGTCLQVIEDKKSYFAPLSVTFSLDGSRLVVGNTFEKHSHSIYIYRLLGVKTAQLIEANERYTNAKVVLVGESGVGKSGLAHRLIEDKFIKTYSTHGMQIWRLDLPIKEVEGIQREALLWDLAGQEDYRLIHQLFLDETALALVLFNPQKDDPFAEVVDWLKALRAAPGLKDRAHEAVKLLIAARTDVGTVKVSQKKIDHFLNQYGFAAYLPTSAKRGENCSDRKNKDLPSALKQLIAQYIPWDTLPWTSTPRLLRELKNAVLEMTEREKVALLRFPELVQRLKQALPEETFVESDVRTAVALLANHCLVMPLKFGDLVLLRPELINDYGSAVIRAARTHIDEIGCVGERDVFERKINFEGVDRLPEADEDLLLRAMAQTFLDKSLCIAEDTPKGKQLIFPSQYRRERTITRYPEIFVSYIFTGELATVYTTLVVRLWYSREFDNRELWRNAAEFMTTKKKIAGLMMERTGEGEGTISVFFDTEVPDELKVVFIEYVHQHLHKYANDVCRDRRYICENCGKPVKDKDAVRKRLDTGKDFIFCQYCDEKVLLIDHIEQRLASDPVAKKVFEMDQTAGHELDTQALEQILIGHMMAICGEANQIFRPVSMFDMGIDGEVEFKDKKGKASGKKIYVQLKSGSSHLRERKRDREIIFDVKNPRHIKYWQNQPVDVYLVIRDESETIRWMNVTQYLKTRKDKKSKQIVFYGEKLDASSVLRLRTKYVS